MPERTTRSDIAKLLNEGILLPKACMLAGREEDVDAICLVVNCNDLFSRGTSETEVVPYDEVESLYEFVESSAFGAAQWACLHRGEYPQEEVKQRWKLAKEWDFFAAMMKVREDAKR